jgi:hypothetical protein
MERAFEILANLEIDVDAIEEARQELPEERKGLRWNSAFWGKRSLARCPRRGDGSDPRHQ